jgi:Putative manganese efflux pump
VRFNIVLAVTLFGAMSFIMSIIGLQLGGKLGTVAGERGELVGAIMLIGLSGVMAAGWLLHQPYESGSVTPHAIKTAMRVKLAPVTRSRLILGMKSMK